MQLRLSCAGGREDGDGWAKPEPEIVSMGALRVV